MIEAAVILSGVVGHWPDFFIIFVLLVANAVVGFWEEHQAGNAIEALKAKLAVKSRVKRDGKWIDPAARELVPGDVIRLHLGDIVPADARLLEGDSVDVNQSALTGESLPATRKSGEAVFSGSIIRQGEIDALVYATGTQTYFGKTTQLVQEAVSAVYRAGRSRRRVRRWSLSAAFAALRLADFINHKGHKDHRGNPIRNLCDLCVLCGQSPVRLPTAASRIATGARRPPGGRSRGRPGRSGRQSPAAGRSAG